MTDDYDDIPALGRLRDQLLEASHRASAAAAEPASAPRSWWRRHRNGLVVAIAGVAVAGGVAGAASLLSVGDPLPVPAVQSARYGPPGASAPQVAVSTRDPDDMSTFAVATYQLQNGDACAITGQLRGLTLGTIEAGTFRPYAPRTGGPCGDLDELPLFYEFRYFPGADRTVLYGRARQPVRQVTLRLDGERSVARTGHGGAFLFLFRGKETFEGLKLSRG